MSVGLQFLASVIISRGATALREVHEGMFEEAELPAFNFIRNYHRRHSQLPTASALQENGIVLDNAPETVTYYVERLRQRAVYQRILAARAGLDDCIRTMNMAGAVDIVRGLSREIADVDVIHDVSPLNDVLSSVADDYAAQHALGSALRGVTLGFEPLDDLTAGAQPGDLWAVVGRPNIGKSWALTYSAYKAWLRGHTILFISMEMSKEQIARRWIGLTSGLNPDFIRRGQLSSRGEGVMHTSIASIQSGAAVHVLSGNFRKSTRDVDDLIQEFNPDAVYVDAGYLMSPERKRKEGSRRENVADVAEELKGVAVDRNRPIGISVQFNRGQKDKKKNKGELDLANIAETDVIAQVTSFAVGMRLGPSPRQRSTRQYELMKNRDGELGKWVGNFRFAPVNLDWLPDVGVIAGNDPDDADAPDAPAQNWMV